MQRSPSAARPLWYLQPHSIVRMRSKSFWHTALITTSKAMSCNLPSSEHREPQSALERAPDNEEVRHKIRHRHRCKTKTTPVRPRADGSAVIQEARLHL